MSIISMSSEYHVIYIYVVWMLYQLMKRKQKSS